MKQTNISLYFFDKKVGRGLAGFKDPAFLENISPPAASVTLVPRRKTKKARFTTHLFQPYMSRLSYQSFVEVIKPFSHLATDDFVFARFQVKVLILHKQFTYRVLPCEHFVIALYVHRDIVSTAYQECYFPLVHMLKSLSAYSPISSNLHL